MGDTRIATNYNLAGRHVFLCTQVFCKLKEINGNALTLSFRVKVGWRRETLLNINVNSRDLNQRLTTSGPRKERQRPSTATSEVKQAEEGNSYKKEKKKSQL